MQRSNLEKAIKLDSKIKCLEISCTRIRNNCGKAVADEVNATDYKPLTDAINNTVQNYFDSQISVNEKEIAQL